MWRHLWVVFLVVNLHIKASFPFEIIPCFDNGNINDLLEINATSVNIPLENLENIQEGDTTQYIVEYSHIKYLGCSNYSTTTHMSMALVDANETDIILEDLVPFSLYNFTLWKIGTSKTCIGNGTFKTNESDILGEDEVPIITDFLNGTEVVATIRWHCENILGQISHKIEVACASQFCVREIQNYDYVINTDSTIVIKFPATKQTQYVLKLTYGRGYDSQYEDHDIFVQVREPAKVEDLKIYAANKTHVSLRWLPPPSNTGVIEFYEIEYYRDIDFKTIQVDPSSSCQIWSKYICYTIYDEDLTNHSYIFEVRAKNLLLDKRGLFSTTKVFAHREIAPTVPVNIYYNIKHYQTLSINWQHPDAPNGPILRFYIEIDNAYLFTYNVSEERLDYNYEIDLKNYNLTSEKILIEIIAENQFDNSSKASTWSAEPHFLKNPTISNATISTFEIEFDPIIDIIGDTSKMYVVVTDPYLPIERNELHPREHELFQAIDVSKNYSWIIGEFELKDNMTERLTVGDNSTHVSELDDTWTFWNRKLDSNSEYNVTLVLNDTLFTTSKLKTYALNGETLLDPARENSIDNNGNSYYFWTLLLIPVSLCIVWAAFMNAVRQRRKSLMSKLLFCDFWDSYNNPEIYSYTSRPRNDSVYDAVLDERNFTRIVKNQDLDDYIKSSSEDDELVRQYELFPRSAIKSHYDGSMIQNRAKNRYPTLVAYDETRVRLEIIHEDPFSDYINANYIDGYNKSKTYIATQTPTDNTYSDFWRMIWQENVKYIIIAADTTQQDQYQSSGTYWPETNKHLDFNDLRVVYRNVEVMPNYKIRHLSLFCDYQERKIQQLHFYGVPDYYRIPLYIQSLSSFMKKILSIPEENSPIVVHCSDGITHTGIVILCDICLKMAISEGQMDIFHNLYKLRNQRMNMVNSAEQYKVVHFVLLRILECLKIPTENGIICDKNMENAIANILATKIPQQMKYLEESTWQEKAMNDIDLVYDCINKGSQVPVFAQLNDDPSQSQLYHYQKIGDSHLYITTAVVDSYSTPSKFVVTPKPITATLGVFWQFIFDRQIGVIVSLNKLALIPDFEDTFNPSPTLEVTCVNHEPNEHFAVYTLETNEFNDKDNKLEVKIIHVLGWLPNNIHPETPNNLIMAYEEMNRLATNRPILITCQDGIQASGLFVAMCFMIEKIGMEHICDICLAVKGVRQSRKDYVKKVEQFTFLYLCALEYVRKFNMYSNFDASISDVDETILVDTDNDLYAM